MNAFDKIIGYEGIKIELTQLCDILQHRERYEKLGAKLPQGLLIYGKPGMGKTLMANCLIESSGLKAYTIRKNRGGNTLMESINNVFDEAKRNSPSIVFIDDMDKFANEDNSHCVAQEYIAIQSKIDEINGSDVFVTATVNDKDKLPDSLLRSGRFDRKIKVALPSDEDSEEIVKHYLKTKKISKDINYEDITKMICYNSCAELETILNEAAINAGFAKRDSICTEDILEAVLRIEYNAPKLSLKTTSEQFRKTAIHEAGHVVICEVLCQGSVGIASIRSSSKSYAEGFVRRCKEFPNRSCDTLISLGGKVATELYYPEENASGCRTDIRRALKNIRKEITELGTCGIGMIDASIHGYNVTENLNTRVEAIAYAELEKSILKVRDILIKNRVFLEKVIDGMIEKETLLYSDIQALRSDVKG